MPRPLQVDLWSFDFKVVSESRVTWATSVPILVFLLPRPLCSWLSPDVRDRQTDVRQTSDAHHRLMPLPYGSGGIIKAFIVRAENWDVLRALVIQPTVKQIETPSWSPVGRLFQVARSETPATEAGNCMRDVENVQAFIDGRLVHYC